MNILAWSKLQDSPGLKPASRLVKWNVVPGMREMEKPTCVVLRARVYLKRVATALRLAGARYCRQTVLLRGL